MLVGMRYGDYKFVFAEQRKGGTLAIWAEPFATLRLTRIFDPMQDPFGRADVTSNTYWDWILDHIPNAYGMTAEVLRFAKTFQAFPPRSTPPSFNPANLMDEMQRGSRAEDRPEKAFPVLREEPNRP